MNPFRAPGQMKQRTHVLAQAPTPKVGDDGVATLRLFDPIDSWGGFWGVSAKEFVEALDALPSNTTEIRLLINSPGGEAFEGIAIMNALRAHPAKVTAVVEGIAASAASFIAAGADELVMMQNSELFIHNAWVLAVGDAKDLRKIADDLDTYLDRNIASIYAAKSGESVEYWLGVMGQDKYLTAEEAVEVKLADRVEGVGSGAAEARARFDLSVFDRSVRAERVPQDLTAPRVEWQLPKPGDRVRIDPDRVHDPAHTVGTIVEVGGTAYGLVMDGMEDMVHRWYTADEFSPVQPDTDSGGMQMRASRLPSSSEPGDPNQKENAVAYSDLTAGLRERLGVTDAEASDEQLLAAVDQALGGPAGTTVPDGTTLIDSEVLASLQADAAQGREAREEQNRARREGVVLAALNEGRISAANREQWLASLEKDEEGTSALIASLPKNTIPVAAIGHSDEPDADARLYAKAWGNDPKEA